MNLYFYILAILIFFYLLYDAYKEGGFKNMAVFGTVFLTLFFGVRIFLIQPFLVEGESMLPTFHSNNYLLVDKLGYRFKDIKRDDVVVFKIPDANHNFGICIIPAFGNCLWYEDRYLIKRIIGLPGDRVVIKDGFTKIFNNENPSGLVLDESFLTFTSNMEDDRVVTEGNYYVMGDNRSNSSDSRYWGLLPKENISGRPLIRLWPVTEFSIFPGKI